MSDAAVNERTPLLTSARDEPTASASPAEDETLALHAERLIEYLLSNADTNDNDETQLEGLSDLTANVTALLYARYLLSSREPRCDDRNGVVQGVKASKAKERAMGKLDRMVGDSLDRVEDDDDLADVLWGRFRIKDRSHLSGG